MKSLFKKIFGRKSQTSIKPLDNVCPNCWGTQEYVDKIVKAIKDSQIEVYNHAKKKAFIQQFVQDRISGILLQKNREGFYCPKCLIQYKKNMHAQTIHIVDIK